MYNGHFRQITDKGLAMALVTIIRRANTLDLDHICSHRNEVVIHAMHFLGVAPGREGEASFLCDDLHRVFDDIMMSLNANRPYETRPQNWRTMPNKLRAKY